MSKIPKLRFKEFSGEWESKKLEDVTSYVDYRGKTPPKSESGIFLVTAKNIKKGYIDYSASQEFISEESYDEAMRRGLPKIGDVLLTTEAPLGSVAQIDREDIALAQRVIKFRGTDELNNTYLKYYFLSEEFQNKLVTKAIGTTVLGIQGKVLHKMPVIFPKIGEQNKIASFISLIDDKISLQGEKVEVLKNYKKGMIQRIFNRELRFKDDEGRDYPEWEETKLGDLLKSVSSGKTKSKKEEGKYKVYGSMGVIGYTENKDYDGEYILIARVGANAGTVNIIDESCGISDNTLAVKCNDEIDCRFLYYKLNQYNLSRLVFGSGQPLITGGQVKSISVFVPTLDEQLKIARYLYIIETKLQKEQEKLDYLNKYKKGLLQQMFI